MRDEVFVEYEGRDNTRREPWSVLNPNSQTPGIYNAGTEFAKKLGDGRGRSCLVIGSPLFEVLELRALGFDVTYLDIRRPPLEGKFIVCDAAKIGLPDESFDAVSSNCVLNHVGTERYGDEFNVNGDEVALAHIARILKKGGRAAITFGPCSGLEKLTRVGILHRVYTVNEVRRMVAKVGLEIEELKIWSDHFRRWLDDGEEIRKDLFSPDFVSVLLRKDAT